MSRITYIPPKPTEKPSVVIPQDTEGEGALIPPSYYLRMSAAVGLGIVVVTWSIAAAVVYYLPGLKPFFWHLIIAGVVLGGSAFGALAVVWTQVAAVRKWRIDDEERRRRHEFEDREYARMTSIMDEGEQFTSGNRLRLTGYEVLAMHYAEGRQASRKECENAGITQGDWNMVNKLLQELGIKSARGWSQDVTYEQALALYRKVTFFDDHSAMVVKSGKQSVRIQLD